MADRILTPEESGSAVVKAVVSKISSSGIFPPDKGFLRRVAYVESKDGMDSATYRNGYHGGIWQVDKIGFEDTKNTASHPNLQKKFDAIKKSFMGADGNPLNWRSVEWSDLRKPLYSGLAARLFLCNVPEPIPCTVCGQAKYWKKHYNTEAGGGTAKKFEDDVKALEK